MPYDIMGADDILGADDLLGAEDILGADDILGAQRRRRYSGIAARPQLLNRIPGVSGPAAAKLPLGFPTKQFLANGAGTAWVATSAQAVTRPQVPVIPRRLVLNVTASAALAGQVMVKVTNVRVGTKSIFTSADGVDAATFAATAFGVELTAESAQPGVEITIDYVLETPAAPTGTGQFVSVSAAFICDSII